jgi:uncharacterized oligopeptide transporter (OPT) family protein
VAEKKLPRTAYELREGETFKPFTHGETPTEFTYKSVFAGIALGMLFGMANTYLGLKAGLTISTSIPVAVLSVVFFRLLGVFGSRHSILELNTSQTVGSASSSVASGVLFTIPALFMWGMSPEWLQITLLAMAGGLIGVLFMVPLRRYLIKKEHGKLPYPEGMACAEVLVAAERGGQQASGVFWGLGFGMFFKLLTSGFKILGIRIASVMVGGAALSALVIIPLINWFGAGMTEPFYPETEHLIRDMSAHDIWHRYVRYIGAGAVACGGFITLIKSIPTMIESFRIGFAQIGKAAGVVAAERTDRDLSFKVVIVAILVILVVLTLVPGILGYIDSIPVRALAAVLVGVFAFFFVTVSSRIVGLVGVTSNPTSGMTIAALLGTSLIFAAAGWTDTMGKATALMVGTVVCIAASIAGDTSQDLKTGFILGATPKFQQIGELAGVITSAGVVAWTISYLHQSEAATGGLGGSELPAPQSVLMKLVVDGVLDANLPWALILIGAALAGVVALFRLPVLAFAVGVYLPLSTMAAVFVGGLTRWLLTRNRPEEEAETRREQGVLLGSGMVGGEGLTGVLLAIWVVAVGGGRRITGIDLHLPNWLDNLLALAAWMGATYTLPHLLICERGLARA